MDHFDKISKKEMKSLSEYLENPTCKDIGVLKKNKMDGTYSDREAFRSMPRNEFVRKYMDGSVKPEMELQYMTT